MEKHMPKALRELEDDTEVWGDIDACIAEIESGAALEGWDERARAHQQLLEEL